MRCAELALKKVLITGATGFIGAHLVAEFLAKNMQVYALFSSDRNLWRLNVVDPNKRATLIKQDLNDLNVTQQVIHQTKPDIIVNAAAYGVNPAFADPAIAFHVNALLPSELAKIADSESVSRFIHLGSCFEYGHKSSAIDEQDNLNPSSIYAITKAAGSLLLQKNMSAVTQICILRLFGQWGPLESSNRLVPQIVMAAQNNRKLDMTFGKQVRDYSYVGDTAKKISYISLLKEFPSQQIINIASGIPLCLSDFVLAIEGALDKHGIVKFGKLPYRQNEMMSLYANVEKQNKIIQSDVLKPISLSDGLRHMLAALQYIKRDCPNEC